jgi:hypothetical protein
MLTTAARNFGQVRVVPEQRLRDNDAEHGVPEELQPLVRRQSTVLVRVRAVGEGVLQQFVSQRYAEPLVQLGVEPRFVGRVHWVGAV